MEVASAWARETTRPNTSLACLAITETSFLSLLPVRPSMTAPITGWERRVKLERREMWSHLQPVSVRLLCGGLGGHDGQEHLQTDVDDVPPGERILSLKVMNWTSLRYCCRVLRWDQSRRPCRSGWGRSRQRWLQWGGGRSWWRAPPPCSAGSTPPWQRASALRPQWRCWCPREQHRTCEQTPQMSTWTINSEHVRRHAADRVPSPVQTFIWQTVSLNKAGAEYQGSIDWGNQAVILHTVRSVMSSENSSG